MQVKSALGQVGLVSSQPSKPHNVIANKSTCKMILQATSFLQYNHESKQIWVYSKYSKTCLKQPLSKRQKIGFQDYLLLNAGHKYCRMLQREHSAIPWTFIKLPSVINILVFSIFEWPLKPGFTVLTSYNSCSYITQVSEFVLYPTNS